LATFNQNCELKSTEVEVSTIQLFICHTPVNGFSD